MYIHVIKIDGIAKCVNYLLVGIGSQKNYIHIFNTVRQPRLNHVEKNKTILT